MDKYIRKELEKTFEKNGNGKDVYKDELKEFSRILKHKIKEGKETKLYRFSKADMYNIISLKNDEIYLSEAGKMNDIFEGVQKSDDEQMPTSKQLEMISDIARIKCFTENKDSSYMWGNYGDSAQGICVEYELSKLDSNSKILEHIFPIVYSDNRFEGDYKIEDFIKCRVGIDTEREKYDIGELSEIDALYLVKSKEWEREKEWRILYNIYDIKEEGCLDNCIKMDCISAVYLGYRMEKKKKIFIREIIKEKNKSRDEKNKIVVYDTIPDSKEYKIMAIK